MQKAVTVRMHRYQIILFVLTVLGSQSVFAAQILGGTLNGQVSVYPDTKEYSLIKRGTWPEDWYALYNEHYAQGKGSWSLVPVKLTVDSIHSKGAVLRSPLFPALFFFRGKQFPPGPLRGTAFARIGQPKMKEINLDTPLATAPIPLVCAPDFPSDQLVFWLNKDRYIFRCHLSKDSTIRVSLSRGDSKQLVYRGEYSEWGTSWVGDLDQDQRLDFIDYLQFESGGCDRVWLSSRAKPGTLVEKAAVANEGCD